VRGGTIFFGLLTILAIAAIVALCLRPSTVIGVSEKSLAYSVFGTAKDGARCQEVKDDEKFECEPPREGDPRYAVAADDYGCWDAKPEGGAPIGSLDGCITIMDLIRLDD
jgi:hypothetical protein